MLKLPEELYARTRERVAAWTEDADVVGIIWIGSRSRGYGDQYADDDLDVVLTPAARARIDPADSFVMEIEPAADPPRLVYDAYMTSLAALMAKAVSTRDLDHWPYEKAVVLFALEHRWAPLDHWLDHELRTLSDPAGAVPALREAILHASHEALNEALAQVHPMLEAEGCPARSAYGALQSELQHPTRAAERAIHGLD